MGRKKEPVSVLLEKGKKHLTKKEIKERQEQELKGFNDKVAPPKKLPKRLHEEFNYYSEELQRLDILTNLDIETLANYILIKDMYDKVTVEMANNIDIFENDSNEIFLPKPVIFCGDLNVAHEEIDLSNPKSNRGKHGFTDEERQGFSNFISADLVDIFRIQNPEKAEIYTWWSHFAKSRERNVGWRIDYFVVSKELNSQNNRAEIHNKILGSDHCPISLELNNA